jgi:hypothetical protein
MRANKKSATYRFFFTATKATVTTTAAISTGAVEMVGDAIDGMSEGFDAAMVELNKDEQPKLLTVVPAMAEDATG